MTAFLILFLAVLLRILANPAANVVQKQLTAFGHHPLFINTVTYVVLALVCVVPAVRLSWSSFDPAFWWYAAATGIAGALGNAFLVSALQGGELSVLGPINSYKAVVSLLLGMVLLGELPGIAGLLGILLIIYGSYFVLDATEERFSRALLRKKEIRYRILALVLTAVEAVFLKKLILLSSVAVSFMVWCGGGALFSLLLLLGGRKGVVWSPGSRWYRLAGSYGLLALCIGTMQFATNFVFARMPVAYALALFQLSMVVTVLFGYHFFREQQIRKKLLGTVIMLAGSVLLILYG